MMRARFPDIHEIERSCPTPELSSINIALQILASRQKGRWPTRMLDFGQFDFGQFHFGQFDEIELAEVEISRSRTDGVCSVSSFSAFSCFLLFLFLFLLFLFFFFFFFLFFFLLLLILSRLTLHFLFVLFLFLSPKTFTLNPKPQTPNPEPSTLRWTTLRWTPLRWTLLRWTPQNFALFYPSPATVFILSSLSWGSFRGILVVFLKAGTLKCARLGSRAVV